MVAHSAHSHDAIGAPASASTTIGEQRFVVPGVTWKDYLVVRDVLDSPGIRMTYLEGMLELMSPSPAHEQSKKLIARLVEIFALERNVPLYGYGSTTFRREAAERGAEPDECWVRGGTLREMPDIALEVVMTSGGIDKLAVYAGLRVPEVWFYEGGAFRLFRLGADGYAPIDASVAVPELDFVLLTAYAGRTDQHEAVLEFRDRLRNAAGSTQ